MKLASFLGRTFSVVTTPVLDGVVCALILATGFARHGLGTSKVLYFDPEY
ncbi:MAG: hypothetical protein ACQET1_01455 [Gemmatimonadota bacterium]